MKISPLAQDLFAAMVADAVDLRTESTDKFRDWSEPLLISGQVRSVLMSAAIRMAQYETDIAILTGKVEGLIAEQSRFRAEGRDGVVVLK